MPRPRPLRYKPGMPIPYDASRTALHQPERAEPLFARSAPASTEALAAETARLAYVRIEESPQELARLTRALALGGYGLPTPFDHAGTDGQGYSALHADGSALLAFRGTQPDR